MVEMIMKIVIKKKLTDKSSLIGKPGYSKANSEADTIERKDFPKGYRRLKAEEKTLPAHEVMGKVRKGRVEVEKRFKADKKEIALHDTVEKRVMKARKRV